MKIDKSCIHIIETSIAPPLRSVITLPTDHEGVVIFVGIGVFTPDRGPTLENAAVSAVATALQLGTPIEPPIEFEPLGDLGAHMTWEEFVNDVDEGWLDDDDGHGDLATVTQRSHIAVYPSDVAGEQALAEYKRPPWATHVVWYNK